MIMKKAISKAFKGLKSEKITTNEELFAKNWTNIFKKTEINALLTSLVLMRYIGKGNVTEYIKEMSYLASKLRIFKLELSEDLLVHILTNIV